MANSDQEVEDSISTLLIESLESTRGGDALLAEDLAWADSCLVKDPEISDGDWSSVKDVLLEILSLQLESQEISAPVSNDIPMIPFTEAGMASSSGGGKNDDFFPMNKEREKNIDDIAEDTSMWLSRIDSRNKIVRSNGAENVNYSGEGISDDSSSMNEERNTNIDGIKEETDIWSSQVYEVDHPETSLRNAFLPNYMDDNEKVSIPIDSGLDMGFMSYETEPSTEDIFRVWELNIPTEEDEFAEQLNKALSESSAQLMPSKVDFSVSGPLEDLKVESLDNLITGIADLSLNQHPS